ncbi:MAG: hypothetical protein K2H80_01895, partial [Ureaplasma sp.]|nr:hypothetical protein [Ureaplasma sp.]
MKIIEQNNLMKSSSKYGIIYEGEIDKILIDFIKTVICRSKTKTPCSNKKHYFKIGGSLSKKDFNFIKSNKKSKNCCMKFLVIDQDEQTNLDIRELENTLPIDYKLIISKPCIEIVLYAIFNT